MKKQVNKKLWLKTINKRTDIKILTALKTIKYLNSKIKERKNKEQINEIINKWATKYFVAKLTREDSAKDELALAFYFHGRTKDKFKIQGKFKDGIWLWTMADFGKSVNFENEEDEFLTFNAIFQILLYKFLKIQKWTNESMKVNFD